jgi:hypothetical protein
MTKRLLLAALTLVSLGGTATAGSGPAIPRPNCFALRDAVGDGALLAQLDPRFQPVSDDALDITGLNVRVTTKTLTVYLSLKDLSDPFTPEGRLPANYNVSFQGVGGKRVSAWLDNFGAAQPAREAVGDVAVPDPSDPPYNVVYVRKAAGAWVIGQAGVPGTPIGVAITKDLAHDFIAWTFDLRTLQKATGFQYKPGRLLQLGEGLTAYSSADVQDVPADWTTTGQVKIGQNHCV